MSEYDIVWRRARICYNSITFFPLSRCRRNTYPGEYVPPELSMIGTARSEAETLFEYDRSRPFEAVEWVLGERDGLTWRRFDIKSEANRVVPGVIVRNSSISAPQPLIMLQHGAGTSKFASFVLAAVDVLANNGFTCMSVDAIGHGERDDQFSATGQAEEERMRRRFSAEYIAGNVADFRRALDYVSAKEYMDPERVGYIGSSMGGMLGALFCAVDLRVKAVVLRCSGSRYALRLLEEAPIDESAMESRRAAQKYDPAVFVGLISPRPLLMLNNSDDEVIPKDAVEFLYNAAGEPKEQRWFPGGHRDNLEVHSVESWLFFDTLIGLSSNKSGRQPV
ncbi:MAG: alpha/beta fold hydrolase [Dehalococcoidia bacterium]|nr:alpha/beta fold hydrolase [Dehalococcoidia bacterium]